MGAKSSAVGYVAMKRQAGLDSPVGGADMTTGAIGSGNPRYFIKALGGIKFSQQPEATRYRELGGGGRDVTLELKEGVTQDPEFEVMARPTTLGMLVQSATGPSAKTFATQVLGGGQVSNGFVRRPAAHATNLNAAAVLSVNYDAGAASLVISGTQTALISGDTLCIGWGPTMEFVTLSGASVVSVPNDTTTVPISALIFPHVKGEPAMRPKAWTKLTAAADSQAADVSITQTVLTVTSSAITAGFLVNRRIAIGAIGTAGTSLGAEFGSSEEVDLHTATPVTATTLTLSATNTAGAGVLLNKHSIGAWVYDVGAAAAAVPASGMIHCFEPMTSLDGENDYYSFARAVSTVLYEQAVDCKVDTLTIMGEAKKPLKAKVSAASRYGKYMSSALAEDYTNQATADVPFRFQNGKYFFKIGSDLELSSKCYGFDFMLDNKVARDIFTDQIFRDEVKDLAREMDLGPKFYFQSGAAYNEIMYGGSAPANNTLPSVNMATGYVVMDFRIDDTTRMAIWIPSVTWSGFPVEADPEPKPIQVEAKCTPLKSGTLPVFTMAIYNKETGRY